MEEDKTEDGRKEDEENTNLERLLEESIAVNVGGKFLMKEVRTLGRRQSGSSESIIGNSYRCCSGINIVFVEGGEETSDVGDVERVVNEYKED